MRAIYVRRGQRAFRRKLLKAYGKVCAVTGCKIAELLEVAHFSPYRGDHTNKVDNGLLLRADVHALFNLGLLWNNEHFAVQIANSARRSPYDELHGVQLRKPPMPADKPGARLLEDHARVSAERSRKKQQTRGS
ncbi:HNH endonuclease signature motif containing protein [Stenotrophomonas sp. Sm6012]|uniref:HNH endonuclease n=1 Tax=Stenotrophomonas sp. Sm6012 TaxID=3002745 RepID=UPI0027E52FBE|nr:HNH endonuclease signature motif containing protein [Stenotrophomonas sp. Sm6012]MDQ7281569.1 HNH endonuclease signature motif containing protein [Stenotrophomonas sp. Sm6012]